MLSHVQLFVTPRTVAHQAPLSLGFSSKEHWSGLPFPSPEHLPNPRIKTTSPVSPALADRFFTTEPPGKPKDYIWHSKNQVNIQSTWLALGWIDLALSPLTAIYFPVPVESYLTLLSLSVLIHKTGIILSALPALFWELNEIMPAKCLAQNSYPYYK